MKHRLFPILLLLMATVFCSAASVLADSGKFWIGYYGTRWVWPQYRVYYPVRPLQPIYPPPGYYNSWRYNNRVYSANYNANYSSNYSYSAQSSYSSSYNQSSSVRVAASSSVAQATQYADSGMVMDNFQNGSGAGFGVFTEERQQAIIAWNGQNNANGEEVLILTTNEQINKDLGKSAITLNIVPLPGAPIAIEPADAKIFEKTKDLMNQKYVANDTGSGFPAVMHKKIGSHEIFVWRLDEQENFKNAVLTYVKEKFQGKLGIYITDEMEAVVQSYFKRGFRYFAFDLSHVEQSSTTREAIAYHFKSSFAYFPLVISQIGGTPESKTTVDLIVMTPGKITMKPIPTKKGKTISDENLFVVRNQSVKFSGAEINSLNERLAQVMKGYSEITVRNILINGELTGFENDFIAIGVK